VVGVAALALSWASPAIATCADAGIVASQDVPAATEIPLAGAGPVVLCDTTHELVPAEPLRHGFTLDLAVTSPGGPATVRIALRAPDGSRIGHVDAVALDRSMPARRVQVSFDPADGRLRAGRPGASPDAVVPALAQPVATIELDVSGAVRLDALELRRGGARANAHTALRDLLGGMPDRTRSRWRTRSGDVRLVESGDWPVWQAHGRDATLERVTDIALAASADAPVVVASFAARVVEDGGASLVLADSRGAGMVLRVDAAGEPGGSLLRLGWQPIGAGGEGDGPGGGAVVDTGRPSAGEPVRITFEWDRRTGRIGAQAERSRMHALGNAAPDLDPVRLSIRLRESGDALGGLLVGTVPRDAVDVRAHGAVGDGLADDGPAVRRAFAAAALGGRPVYVPPGVHRIVVDRDADALTVDASRGVATLIGAGHGSTLLAARRERVAVRLAGDGPVLARLRLMADEVRHRHSEPLRAAVNLVEGSVDAVVVDNELGPTEETGVIAFGARRPLIVRNRVTGTLADGIHLTHASSGALVADNLVRRTGDDAIAVVSYRFRGGRPVDVVRDVEILDNDVGRNRLWGRGIAVVGGAEVRIRRNRIAETNAAGLLLAAEQHYDTAGVTDVTVEDNVIERPRVGAVPHAGVLLWADAGAPWRRIERVTLLRNTVTEAGWRGMTIGCGAVDVDVVGNAILDSAALGVLLTGTSGRIRLLSNTVRVRHGDALLATPIDTWCPQGSTGSLEIAANRFEWRAVDPACDRAALAIAAAAAPRWRAVAIDGNRFAPSGAACVGSAIAVDAHGVVEGDPCASNRSEPVAGLRVDGRDGTAPTTCRLRAR
jgi:hypothetical protein